MDASTRSSPWRTTLVILTAMPSLGSIPPISNAASTAGSKGPLRILLPMASMQLCWLPARRSACVGARGLSCAEPPATGSGLRLGGGGVSVVVGDVLVVGLGLDVKTTPVKALAATTAPVTKLVSNAHGRLPRV